MAALRRAGNRMCFTLQSIVMPCVACQSLHTTSAVFKRKPRSAHIPRWAQALSKRSKLNEIMYKPTSERRLAAQQRLKEDTREFLINVHGIKPPPYMKTMNLKKAQGPRPDLLLSDDRQMIICYHPAQDFPLDLTSDLPSKPVWYMNESEIEGYSQTLTSEEAREAQSLVTENVNVWSLRALSHLFQARPEAIKASFKLTKEQKRYLLTEKALLDEMNPKKRVLYRRMKVWEMIQYARKTRGVEFADAFKKKILYRPEFS